MLGTGLGTRVGIQPPLLLDTVVLFLSFLQKTAGSINWNTCHVPAVLIDYEFFDLQVINTQNCEENYVV